MCVGKVQGEEEINKLNPHLTHTTMNPNVIRANLHTTYCNNMKKYKFHTHKILGSSGWVTIAHPLVAKAMAFQKIDNLTDEQLIEYHKWDTDYDYAEKSMNAIRGGKLEKVQQ